MDLSMLREENFFVNQYTTNIKCVEEARVEHLKTTKFIVDLNNKNIQEVKDFLVRKNKGPAIPRKGKTSKTICLMDATGSMRHLLNNAKLTVGTMFERGQAILMEHNIKEPFEMQFAVYRNYNAKLVLEYSPFESRPNNLKSFMNSISVDGGYGPEAIEIGLWHVNQVKDVSQVILIGDAPAQSKEETIENRSSYKGENYWRTTEYKDVLDYQEELAKIKVPIHCFYVDEYAKKNFLNIFQNRLEEY